MPLIRLHRKKREQEQNHYTTTTTSRRRYDTLPPQSPSTKQASSAFYIAETQVHLAPTLPSHTTGGSTGKREGKLQEKVHPRLHSQQTARILNLPCNRQQPRGSSGPLAETQARCGHPPTTYVPQYIEIPHHATDGVA